MAALHVVHLAYFCLLVIIISSLRVYMLPMSLLRCVVLMHRMEGVSAEETGSNIPT